MIKIYTDGSSRGNPGPGGYGVVIFNAEDVKELGGREEKTTNNRMELKAALEAIKTLPADANSEIELFTDSSYLLNGITKWVHGWIKNGWITKTKDEVLNRDLWESLEKENGKRKVSWQKVVGHSGHAFNERCDSIATDFADNKKVILYVGSISDYKIKESNGSGVNTSRSSSSKGRVGKAYSYISKVGGLIQTHQTWAECERRVKGVKGARFKKALSSEEEKEIIQEFHK